MHQRFPPNKKWGRDSDTKRDLARAAGAWLAALEQGTGAHRPSTSR
jgi:hypothetical protein